MGVKLLQSFLKKHADCLVNTINVSPRENHNNNHPGPCEANAPPQFIIVDAHGFLISLSEEVHTLFDAWSASNHRDVFPDADLVGGDLQAVRSALAHLVKRLIAVYGVQLIFAVDAPRGMRSDTCERDAVWDQRARENQDALVQRMEYCKGKTPFKHTKRNSRRTTPFMLSSQLFATLRAMCVPILQLDDEVDGYIGALVHELQPLCVFTGDTDFIVTDGIPVVMEFDLPWDAMLFGWEYHKGSGSVSAATTAVVAQPDLALPTIQAASLVSYLDLSSPDELYLAASLCGNDITSHHLVALRSASAIPPASSSHHQRHNGVYTITDAAKDVVQHYRGNDGQYSVETLPDVIQLSIDRYREAARRIAYTPSLDPTLLAILDKVVAEQLPVHFVGLIRSGFCMDGPTPLLDGNFGYVHDLFTFKRLRHAVAHILGRTSFNVYERGEQRSVAKIIAKKINSNSNDDDKTTDGAKSTKVEDDSVSAPATIELLREIKVELPREVISALPPVWNSVEDQQLNRTTRDPVEKILALGPLLTMFPGQGLSLLSSATQQDAQGKSIPQSITLILWALHSACTCSKEVQRILEMMVLIHTSERGNPTQQAVARNILQGLPKVKTAAVSTAAKKRGDAADEDNRPLDVFHKRPSVRTLELAHLFASAYDSTRSLVKVLRLHDDIAFPEPADVFSGTLLHVLESNSPLTANTLKEARKSGTTTGNANSCSGSGEVDQVVNDIIASVERLSSTFHTMFETIQYRKPQGDGDDGVRIIHVDQVYQWAGILQQHEETIDTLETGGTSRTQMSIASSSAAAALQQSQLFAAKTPEEGNATSSSALPIDEHIPALLAAISANRVVCVQGDTGCGKSSMIPLHLYLDAVKSGQRVQIVVTQPRRLAAVALAQRVSSLLGEEVGTTVGYRLGGNAREESSATRIFFVTAGYLLESLVHGSNLWSRTTHLLLDEVHERSLDADMLSLVIRLMLQHDDDVEASSRRQHAKRLVVMSATIQAELFMNYFMPLQWRTGGGSSSPESPTATGVVTAHDTMEMPLLHVGGRHMQVEEMYLPDVIALLQASHVPQDVLADLLQYQKRVDRAVSRAAFAISAQDIRALCSLMMACVKPATCILVFLPGLKEIEDCFEELTNRRTRSPVNLRVHALHSIVDGDDQARVLIPADASECKIVLSTNIAETSMTIPDVKVVIDLGFARRVVYDEAKRLQCIQCVWCSRAAAKQRAGRAGRVSNGLVLRLYTQSTMRDIMPDFEESDCFPLEASVLKVRQHLGQYGDVEGLMQQLVEPPTTTMVAEALARLVEWGALGPAPSYDILELGEVATMLPIDVSLTKSVLLASRFGCAADMLVIAAGLTLQRSPYRLPMRAFFQSDYEFQENVMLALRSIHHFDQQRCNDLFQYIAILEEALAAGGRLGDFCTRWYLSFRQVQSLLRTTKLLCKRLLTAEQAGKMRFTDADRATMRRLSGEHHHASSSSSSLRFQSLTDEGCSELLQLALAQDAERMVSASVESLTNSLQRLLDNAKAPDGRPPAWLISPESFHSDVVFFSGVDKTVAGAGSKALADHLKLFDVKDSLVFPVGHGTYGAVVRVPHEKETETADRSVSAAGGQPHPQPHPLSVAARTDAICRMGRLYRSSHWSFCTSKEGDMSSSMSLPKAQTTATVKRWKAVELPSKSMNTAESSDDDDDDDYERDDEDDSTAAYSSGSDSSASLPAKTSNRAKKGAAKGKQQKKKKQLTAVVANLQLDRWSAVGSTSTVLLGAGVKSIPAFGFAFNLMSTQASMLLASTVLMINANGGFPLLALLASRRSTQLPLVLQVSVLKPDPFSDNDAPLVKHIATNIPSYDLILESAAAAQSNNATICATTFLELNLIRMLLCTGVAAASPHGDNKQPSRSNKHLGMPQQQVSQLLPTAEAILRTISDIRSLRSSNAANNGARQFVISSGAPPSKSKWETMQLRVARLEAHPQLALYDIATLVEAQRSGVCSATTTSNAAAAPRTAWQRAIHAYTTCVANTAVSITALAVQHQKKQSVHMKRQASNEVPQSVAAPPHADVIALLASNGGDVGAQTNDKRTPLHMAAANGHTLALVELLRLNASIDVADANGTTPLHIAAVNGRVDAVKALLDHHASVGAVMKDGATAIHLAAQGGHADVIAVLAIHGGDVDAQGYDNVAPLHCAAANLHSDALVWSDAVRKWKQQSKETAAPPAVPPASPTLLEPHALPLSRCEGNCLMEFSRHSTSETAVEQLGMLLENTELLDTVLGSFTDVIKCTDDRNLKIIAFLDCLRSRIFLRRTGARDFMDFTNFDPSRMLTMKSAFSHLCDMQLHALQSICLPDSRRPSEAAQALDITDQLPKCFECDDGARNRIILNLWEVVQRKKRTVEPLRSAVEGVDPSILTKLCSTIAGGSTTRTRFARLNLESLGIDSDKWNAFAASNPFNRRNFVREIRSICHEQLKDDANRTLFATNALRFLGGQAVATLLDEIQFAHESGSGLTCMFHPSCQWKVASVDVTWDAFVAHVKEEHCGEGPLGLAFALDNRAYDLDCDAFLRTDPMDTFIFQRKLTQHFFCPVCFRVSDSGDCQPFENYDAMTDHVLRCHNCHGHGSAREVLRCQRAQAIYGFQFQKEPGFRYVQLCSPADRLDARLLFYSNKDRKSLTRCLVCQLHCRNFEATQSHMLHVHPELFDRNETHSVKSSILHCPVDAFECGERFDTPGSLLEHINTSHPHMCGVYGPTIRLSSRWSPSTSFKEILERTAVFIPALVRTLAPTVELSKRSPDEKSVPCRVRILVRSGSETEKQPFVNGPCCLWRTHPPHSPTFISDKNTETYHLKPSCSGASTSPFADVGTRSACQKCGGDYVMDDPVFSARTDANGYAELYIPEGCLDKAGDIHLVVLDRPIAVLRTDAKLSFDFEMLEWAVGEHSFLKWQANQVTDACISERGLTTDANLTEYLIWDVTITLAKLAHHEVNSEDELRVAVLDSPIQRDHAILQPFLMTTTTTSAITSALKLEKKIEGLFATDVGEITDELFDELLKPDDAPIDHGTNVAGLVVLGANLDLETKSVSHNQRANITRKKLRISHYNVEAANEKLASRKFLLQLCRAIADDCKVINISFVTPEHSSLTTTIQNILAEARDRFGCVVVVATGNGWSAYPYFPASDASVIAVSSIGSLTPSNLRLKLPRKEKNLQTRELDYIQTAVFDTSRDTSPPQCEFSNFPLSHDFHVGANGLQSYSIVCNGAYGLQLGTSMAAPVVAGAIANAFCSSFPQEAHDIVEGISDFKLYDKPNSPTSPDVAQASFESDDFL